MAQCDWILKDEDYGVYKTSCGEVINKFEMSGDIEFNFCPCCSREINIIEQKKVCTWAYDGKEYKTECGGTMYFNDVDNFSDAGFQFCPKCGGNIEEENHDE